MPLEAEKISLDFVLTREDVKSLLEDYNKSQEKQSRKTDLNRWLTLIAYCATAISVPGLTFVLVKSLTQNDLLAFFGLTGSAVVWSSLHTRLWVERAVRKMSKYSGLIGKHQVTISAEGVSDRNSVMEYTIFWSQTSDIQVGREHVLIFFRFQERTSLISLPRRVFANDREMVAFVERISLFWKSSAER